MKASSESGLWATVISRTGAETILIEFTILGANLQNYPDCRVETRLAASPPVAAAPGAPWEAQHASSLLQCTSSLRRELTVPARCKPRGHQDLDDLCEREPVQSPLDRHRQGMSQHKQPD